VEVADAIRVELLVAVGRVRGLAERGLGARRVLADALGVAHAVVAVAREGRDLDGARRAAPRADERFEADGPGGDDGGGRPAGAAEELAAAAEKC
jgi:hypothetical protein